MKRSLLITLAFVASLIPLATQPVGAQTAIDCVDVFAIFGRGSGQTLGNSPETETFFSELRDRITEVPEDANGGGVDGYTVDTYELGEGYDGFAYPAVGGFRDIIDSELSWLGGPIGGQYRDSVDEGTNEAVALLNDRAVACPNEQVIIGGYSQGAQALGEALFQLTPEAEENVAFVAFFGDPKLDTRDGGFGFIGFSGRQACAGNPHPWRRGNHWCNSTGGILESRIPYVPDAFRDKTGSWCKQRDGICQDLIAFAFAPLTQHATYPEKFIPEAAQEAASRLAERLPNGNIFIEFRVFQTGTGLDVVFVIDTTGSMGAEIADVRANSLAIANQLLDQSSTFFETRIGLVEYRDHGDAFVSRTVVPFTKNASEFETGINGLRASGGGDFPEAVFSGLWTAFNEFDWQEGASKATILIGDAPGKDPEPITGLTEAQIHQRALEIDPVNIYTINVSSNSSTESFYRSLSEGSEGSYIEATGGQTVSGAVLEVLTEINNDPVPLIRGPLFVGTGMEITFDASRSLDFDSEIVSYAWDFDNDGIDDLTTSDSIVTYTYPGDYDGLAVLTITSADGDTANGVVEVTVAPDPFADLRPDPPANVTAVAQADGSVTLSWQPSPSEIDSYLIYRPDGTRIGTTPASDTTEVRISDIPSDTTSTTFIVTAQNEFAQSVPVESNSVQFLVSCVDADRNEPCVVPRDTTIDGNLTTNSTILVLGEVTGNVKSTGDTITVGSTGVVGGNIMQNTTGDIVVEQGGVVDGSIKDNGPGSVTISGSVNGSVQDNGDGDVVVTASGVVAGDVKENGNGSVVIGGLVTGDVQENGNGDCAVAADAVIGGNRLGGCQGT